MHHGGSTDNKGRKSRTVSWGGWWKKGRKEAMNEGEITLDDWIKSDLVTQINFNSLHLYLERVIQ